MHIDTHAMDTMMKTMHRDTSTYVKNKLRKEKPKAFISALRIQNKCIPKVKMLSLVGIPKTATSSRGKCTICVGNTKN